MRCIDNTWAHIGISQWQHHTSQARAFRLAAAATPSGSVTVSTVSLRALPLNQSCGSSSGRRAYIPLHNSCMTDAIQCILAVMIIRMDGSAAQLKPHPRVQRKCLTINVPRHTAACRPVALHIIPLTLHIAGRGLREPMPESATCAPCNASLRQVSSRSAPNVVLTACV